MTREETVNWLESLKHDIGGAQYIDLWHYEQAINMAIEALKAQEWIPAIKKPEAEEKTYLIQTDGGYVCSCRWTNVNHFWTDLTTDWHWHIMDIPQYNEVVAWMPLPEPYTKDKEKKDE